MKMPRFIVQQIEKLRPVGVEAADEAAKFTKQHREKFAERKQAQLQKDVSRHAHKRQEERLEFSVVAELSIPDKGFSIEGVISEASKGGLTFRPATSYLIDRVGERVQIIVDRIKRNGIIRSTRVNGYGIQLLEQLSQAELDTLASQNVDLVDPNQIEAA